MKNATRFLIIVSLFFNLGQEFTPESYTTPLDYDGTLRAMDAGKIRVIKLPGKKNSDTLKGEVDFYNLSGPKKAEPIVFKYSSDSFRTHH